MRKSQRLPERKSTSCLASTRKCCPAMRGVEPSACPPPSAPWHEAQLSKSASPLIELGVARSVSASSRCSVDAATAKPENNRPPASRRMKYLDALFISVFYQL